MLAGLILIEIITAMVLRVYCNINDFSELHTGVSF